MLSRLVEISPCACHQTARLAVARLAEAMPKQHRHEALCSSPARSKAHGSGARKGR